VHGRRDPRLARGRRERGTRGDLLRQRRRDARPGLELAEREPALVLEEPGQPRAVRALRLHEQQRVGRPAQRVLARRPGIPLAVDEQHAGAAALHEPVDVLHRRAAVVRRDPRRQRAVVVGVGEHQVGIEVRAAAVRVAELRVRLVVVRVEAADRRVVVVGDGRNLIEELPQLGVARGRGRHQRAGVDAVVLPERPLEARHRRLERRAERDPGVRVARVRLGLRLREQRRAPVLQHLGRGGAHLGPARRRADRVEEAGVPQVGRAERDRRHVRHRAVDVVRIEAAVVGGGHAALRAAGREERARVDRAQRADDPVLVVGHLADRQVRPVGGARPRLAEVAVLDRDLVGGEQHRQLVRGVAVVVPVAAGQRDHRRVEVAVEQRHALLERRAVRAGVIDRLGEAEDVVRVRRRLGRERLDRHAVERAQLGEQLLGIFRDVVAARSEACGEARGAQPEDDGDRPTVHVRGACHAPGGRQAGIGRKPRGPGRLRHPGRALPSRGLPG
jgi:hypothetical protein